MGDLSRGGSSPPSDTTFPPAASRSPRGSSPRSRVRTAWRPRPSPRSRNATASAGYRTTRDELVDFVVRFLIGDEVSVEQREAITRVGYRRLAARLAHDWNISTPRSSTRSPEGSTRFCGTDTSSIPNRAGDSIGCGSVPAVTSKPPPPGWWQASDGKWYPRQRCRSRRRSSGHIRRLSNRLSVRRGCGSWPGHRRMFVLLSGIAVTSSDDEGQRPSLGRPHVVGF